MNKSVFRMVLAVALFTAAMAFTENAVSYQIGLARLERQIAQGLAEGWHGMPHLLWLWRDQLRAELPWLWLGAAVCGICSAGVGFLPRWRTKENQQFSVGGGHSLALIEGQKENRRGEERR